MSTRYITTRKALETGLTAIFTHADLLVQQLDQFGAQAVAERAADQLICHLSVHTDTVRRGEPEIKSQPAPDPLANFFG